MIETIERTDIAPIYCECGCGGITNTKQIEAWRLRGRGLKAVDIAELWGWNPGSAKGIFCRKPSRYLKGHAVYRRMASARTVWTCERCGGQGFVSVGKAIPRYCQRHACLAKVHPTWAAIARAVDQNQSHRQARLSSFFAAKSPRLLATRRDQLQSFQRERADVTAAWVAVQDPDVQTLVATQGRDLINVRDRHFDSAMSNGPRPFTLYDVTPSGFNPRGIGVQWVDPVAAAVEAAWEEPQGEVAIDDPRFLVLAKRVAILPADFVTRCERNELRLIVDSNGPAFFTVPSDDAAQWTHGEAVPWRDYTGPMPSFAVVSAGKMARHGTHRKRLQRLASGGRGHPSQKSKSAA